MEGTISVQSATGTGSSFTVELPLERAEARARSERILDVGVSAVGPGLGAREVLRGVVLEPVRVAA